MWLDCLILFDTSDSKGIFKMLDQATCLFILKLVDSKYFISSTLILCDSYMYISNITDSIISFYFKSVYVYFKSFSLIFLNFSSNVTSYTVKFILMISILVFARGGIPRYRYDYLTKLGWIRCLSWIGFWFLLTVLSIFFF